MKQKCTTYTVTVIGGPPGSADDFIYDYAGQTSLCEAAKDTAENWLKQLGVTPPVSVLKRKNNTNGDVEWLFNIPAGIVVPQSLEPWPEDTDP